MDDKSDPLDGWPIWEVLRQPWIAKEDCYGKLYAYIHSIFQRFLDRLASANVSFEMHCVDAKELKNHLPRDKYTRIEVRLPIPPTTTSKQSRKLTSSDLQYLGPLPRRNPLDPPQPLAPAPAAATQPARHAHHALPQRSHRNGQANWRERDGKLCRDHAVLPRYRSHNHGNEAAGRRDNLHLRFSHPFL